MLNAFDAHYSTACAGVYRGMAPGPERDAIIDALNGIVREYVRVEAIGTAALLAVRDAKPFPRLELAA